MVATSEEKAPKRGKRKRQERIEVVMDASEKAEILALAEQCGLSGSAYLRNVGLGTVPRSRFDALAVRDFVKAHADLGRLGGLLKLWLSARPGEGASVEEVRSVLREIEEQQAGLRQLVKRL